jgi:hypothetical protein
MHSAIAAGMVMLLAGSALPAAEPKAIDAALRIVPEDAAVCFVIRNLRDRADTVAKSPFAMWATGPVNGALAGVEEFQALKLIEAMFKEKIGLSLAELRDDILGDLFVHAYTPAPPGKDTGERSLVIVLARDAKKLATLIDRLNAYQKESGEILSLKTHQSGGKTFIEREKQGAPSDYYAVQGQLFLFASSAAAMQLALDRHDKAVALSPAVAALADRGADDAFLACVIAPRAFDGMIRAVDPAASDTEKAGKAQMAKLWSALDQCVIALHADEGLELSLRVSYRAEALPAEVKDFLGSPPKKSPLWRLIPEDALFAVALQADATAILEAIGSFLPASDRPQLRKPFDDFVGPMIGKEQAAKLLTLLGPEMGIWAVAEPTAWFPRIVAALRVTDTRDAPGQIRRVCGFYMQALQFQYNRDHMDRMEFIEESVQGIELKRFVNDALFPPGISPTVAIHDGYLVAGSMPDVVLRFKAPSVASPESGEVPVLAVSFKAIAAHFAKHKPAIATWIAHHKGLKPAEVEREIEALQPVFEALDRFEVVVRGDDHSRTLALKLKLIQSLK